MKDFLGQELRIGDNVVEVTNSSTGRFNKSIITGFTNRYVILNEKIALVNYYGPGKHYISKTQRTPEKIIKIDTILNNM